MRILLNPLSLCNEVGLSHLGGGIQEHAQKPIWVSMKMLDFRLRVFLTLAAELKVKMSPLCSGPVTRLEMIFQPSNCRLQINVFSSLGNLNHLLSIPGARSASKSRCDLPQFSLAFLQKLGSYFPSIYSKNMISNIYKM